jgi:SAM-dependent methyltransferase
MAVKTIIDLAQVRRNRRRAAFIDAEGADFLFRAMAEDLDFRLSTVKREFERGVLFVPDGAPRLPMEESGILERHGPDNAAQHEALGLPEAAFDLAVSLLTLHETNDTPGVLSQIRRALKPDGLFLACVPAAGTLAELRDCLIAAEAELSGAANARVLPFMDVRDAGALLQRAGFALPVTDGETLTVRYDTLFNLMLDLRAMGATNTLASRSRSFARRALFLKAAEIYAMRHSDADGRVRATFSFVWMSGWAPHDSQQKPLRPGSATTRLADVLKDRSGGEKADVISSRRCGCRWNG